MCSSLLGDNFYLKRKDIYAFLSNITLFKKRAHPCVVLGYLFKLKI